MKVFGSYGKFFDIMKLNVAISSFGGQYWNDCAYTLDTADLTRSFPLSAAAAGIAHRILPIHWITLSRRIGLAVRHLQA